MNATKCSCGFTELGDEGIIDHLHSIFEPADLKGNDGQVHQETDHLVCSCGLSAATSEDLDNHFLEVFTPADAVGRDGKKHGVVGAA